MGDFFQVVRKENNSMKVIKRILSFLHMDAHHKMERFGILFLCLILALGSTTLSIGAKHIKDSSQQLTDQVIYTKTFETSLSGVSGTVENIYTNRSRTKAFILLKFSDVSDISVDANEYQMFLTGSNLNQEKTDLDINPSGSIYMFGSTGYMGIYLVENRGFQQQILDLVVRNNRNLLKRDLSSKTDLTESFRKFDQFRIYFNAGGTSSTVSTLLDQDKMPAVSDLYGEFILKSKEKELRKTLDATEQQMKLDLDKIQEYTKRLTDRRPAITPSLVPLVIADDSYQERDGKLYFDFKHTVPTGFSFNWRDGLIQTGYLKALAKNESVVAYLKARTSETEETKSLDEKVTFEPFMSSKVEWLSSAGTTIDTSASAIATTSDQTLLRDINDLQSAWRTYYSNKSRYQTTELKELLLMELELLQADSNFTLNQSSKVLKNW